MGLRSVWAAMRSDPDLATGSVRVLGLVGDSDAMVLLDRARAGLNAETVPAAGRS